MDKIFTTNIDGYWREKAVLGIPTHSGVYFVWEASFNQTRNSVSLKKIIYIGEADNVRNRIQNHEKYKEWLKHVRTGNVLCYSTCEVEPYYRNRVEAAYIFKHKPPVNVEYKDSFPFDRTRVISKGETGLLNTDFNVDRT